MATEAKDKGKVMTAKERLLHLLFGREGITHRNIKFWRGDQPDVTEDQFCDAISSALVRRRTGVLKPLDKLPRSDKSVNVKEFIDAL